MITVELDLSPQDRLFRESVRGFIREAFTADLQQAAARQAGVFAEPSLGLEWQRRLHARGWGAPGWPKRWGGAEFTPIQRYIFSVECAAAGTPVVAGMGLLMCGPVLMRFGTPEQQERFLPRIPPMEDYWCQGFSEPGAGSDLSALRCRAERIGDEYVINGSKIWTTHAHAANWIFMLVRTSAGGKRKEGITFLLSPMDAPGITVRPIASMSGEHEVNEVFFDNVRVPVSLRVGEEGQGWDIAQFLLMNERGGTSAAAALKNSLHRTRRIASCESDERGRRVIENADFQRRLATIEIEIAAVEATELRTLISGGLSGTNGNALTVGSAGSVSAGSGLAVLYLGDTNSDLSSGLTVRNSGAIDGNIEGYYANGSTAPLAEFGNPAQTAAEASLDATADGGPAVDLVNLPGGVLSGAGRYIADVTNEGTLVVGTAGDRSGLDIAGDFVQRGGGTTVADAHFILGESDAIRVAGRAELGGTLTLRPVSVQRGTEVTVLGPAGERRALPRRRVRGGARGPRRSLRHARRLGGGRHLREAAVGASARRLPRRRGLDVRAELEPVRQPLGLPGLLGLGARAVGHLRADPGLGPAARPGPDGRRLRL